ncbi:MAG: hypothetical protein IPN29_04520 [Saprospiraceae bacterium]|nr:hypothetical protein [Saprospiraceae bacterium]
MKNLWFVVLAFPCFAFCQSTRPSLPSWISGNWYYDEDVKGKSILESWSIGKETYTGMSVTRRFGQQIFAEEMVIKYKGDTLVFGANVPENEDWVYFPCIQSNTDSVVFENPTHDFPKRIAYYRHGTDSLKAKVGDGTKHLYYAYRREQGQKEVEVTLNGLLSDMMTSYNEGRFEDVAKVYNNDAVILGGQSCVEGKIDLVRYWKDLGTLGGKWKLTAEWTRIFPSHILQKGRSVITDINGQKHEVEFLLHWKRTGAGWKIDQDFFW